MEFSEEIWEEILKKPRQKLRKKSRENLVHLLQLLEMISGGNIRIILEGALKNHQEISREELQEKSLKILG